MNCGVTLIAMCVYFLSGEYIGQKLKENGFDPKGRGTSMLDDLVRYQLHCFCYCILTVNCVYRGVITPGLSQYPNRQEREAMILSSFAGMLLESYIPFPLSFSPHLFPQSNIVHPFSLSYHPFAMLSSYKASLFNMYTCYILSQTSKQNGFLFPLLHVFFISTNTETLEH
uniref:Uncharacterized protein n=1 Tax=Pygocentrus nattereri TaxID=42514 RepID=A0A3B4E2C7_PYGNA